MAEPYIDWEDEASSPDFQRQWRNRGCPPKLPSAVQLQIQPFILEPTGERRHLLGIIYCQAQD